MPCLIAFCLFLAIILVKTSREVLINIETYMKSPLYSNPACNPHANYMNDNYFKITIVTCVPDCWYCLFDLFLGANVCLPLTRDPNTVDIYVPCFVKPFLKYSKEV